jgi:hypothetical protein
MAEEQKEYLGKPRIDGNPGALDTSCSGKLGVHNIREELPEKKSSFGEDPSEGYLGCRPLWAWYLDLRLQS